MDQDPQPSIKGIFVMSHVDALETKKGHDGIVELLARYGKPIRFGIMDDVPVREEVAIIEHTLDILTGGKYHGDERAFEAGRLHLHNFSRTALGGMVLPIFRTVPQLFFLHADLIAKNVFRHVRFVSEEKGPRAIRVVMENNDYPLLHFAGFFQGVLEYGGFHGSVVAEDLSERRYAYDIAWHRAEHH